MIRAANSFFLVLPLLILCPVPARAQVRPGLAHRLEAVDRADSEARGADLEARPESASHDPDRDGALIGAAIGATGLSILWCHGAPYCGLGVIGGILIGGVAGLVVGGLVDAADPLTPRTEEPPAAPRDSIVAAAPAVPDSTGHPRRRSPTSRRNDLIGAAIGAVAGDLLVYSACTSLSEGGSCPIFHWKYWPAIGIGALLGAGIGSSFGELEEPEEAEEPSP